MELGVIGMQDKAKIKEGKGRKDKVIADKIRQGKKRHTKGLGKENRNTYLATHYDYSPQNPLSYHRGAGGPGDARTNGLDSFSSCSSFRPYVRVPACVEQRKRGEQKEEEAQRGREGGGGGTEGHRRRGGGGDCERNVSVRANSLP